MNAPRLLLASILLFAVPAAVQAADEAALQFDAAWIRAAPPSSKVMAGYVRISNSGSTDVVIEALSSPAFGSSQMHEMREAEGMMQMRALPELSIAPGASVDLAPGGTHLMLMRPTRALGVGERVQIDFVLRDGGRQTATFEVRDDAPG